MAQLLTIRWPNYWPLKWPKCGPVTDSTAYIYIYLSQSSLSLYSRALSLYIAELSLYIYIYIYCRALSLSVPLPLLSSPHLLLSPLLLSFSPLLFFSPSHLQWERWRPSWCDPTQSTRPHVQMLLLELLSLWKKSLSLGLFPATAGVTKMTISDTLRG